MRELAAAKRRALPERYVRGEAMNPITHPPVGWGLASSAPLDRRERAYVTLAGVVPDFNGLGIIVDVATWSSAAATELWGTYHHVLGHKGSPTLGIESLPLFQARDSG